MTKPKPKPRTAEEWLERNAPVTFAGWIEAYGVRALARRLSIDPSSVSSWKKGKTQPNLRHAATILKLAKGKLKPADLVKGGPR